MLTPFSLFLGSAVRISRKGWHMLLNFCFHTALTFAVFAGGINRIKYPIICQAVSAFPIRPSRSRENERGRAPARRPRVCLFGVTGAAHSGTDVAPDSITPRLRLQDATPATGSKQMALSAILIPLAHLQFSVTLASPFRELIPLRCSR